MDDIITTLVCPPPPRLHVQVCHVILTYSYITSAHVHKHTKMTGDSIWIEWVALAAPSSMAYCLYACNRRCLRRQPGRQASERYVPGVIRWLWSWVHSTWSCRVCLCARRSLCLDISLSLASVSNTVVKVTPSTSSSSSLSSSSSPVRWRYRLVNSILIAANEIAS